MKTRSGQTTRPGTHPILAMFLSVGVILEMICFLAVICYWFRRNKFDGGIFTVVLLVELLGVALFSLIIHRLRRPPQPVRETAWTPRQQKWFVGIFCGLFVILGTGVGYLTVIHPVWQMYRAQEWLSVPCRILSSRVETVPATGHGTTTYRIDIHYQYDFQEKNYTSDRYDFSIGSDSSYQAKQKAVRRYRVGSKQSCYVNPRCPEEAVIVRRTGPLWIGLVPLAFLLMGGTGLILLVKGKVGDNNQPENEYSTTDIDSAQYRSGGSIPLKMRKSPWRESFMLLLIAGFWNGIVSVFVVDVVKNWKNGNGEWFATLFLIPFVAIGLLLLGLLITHIISGFTPRPQIRIEPACPQLNRRVTVFWKKADRQVVQKLTITAEGKMTFYRRNSSDSERIEQKFWDCELLITEDPVRMASGQGDIQLPARAPNFPDRVDRPQIVWLIRVNVKTPNRPEAVWEYYIPVRRTVTSSNCG